MDVLGQLFGYSFREVPRTTEIFRNKIDRDPLNFSLSDLSNTTMMFTAYGFWAISVFVLILQR